MPAKTDPGDRSTEFVPVQGGPESTSATTLLVSAYVGMWAILFLFVLLSWRKQQRIDQRLAQIDRALGALGNAEKR
jgi:uncharacterized membrane protein